MLVILNLQKEKEEGKSEERRPFDRNIDLQANRFDEGQKKAIFKKAQLLNDRFSSGRSKFLWVTVIMRERHICGYWDLSHKAVHVYLPSQAREVNYNETLILCNLMLDSSNFVPFSFSPIQITHKNNLKF